MKIESTIGAKAGGYVDKWIKWAGGGNRGDRGNAKMATNPKGHLRYHMETYWFFKYIHT